MGYALVKIKEGARIYQDMRFGVWDSNDSPVFAAEKRVRENRIMWICRAPGHGGEPYGNGAIHVNGFSAVELLTPILGYKPEIPSRGTE